MKDTQRELGKSLINPDVFSPTMKQTYLSKSTTHQPGFSRNIDKTEAMIKPEAGGLIQIANKKKKLTAE